jgi:pimeloyl-ACP methyl ester carboxylesterase
VAARTSVTRGGARRYVAAMRERYVTANGLRFFCLEAGDPADPLVLLCHGFPEISLSWRHQIDALAELGFHVVAPDLPGYGRTDKPDVTYDIEFINGSLAALVRSLGHDRVVIAGHDWGGILVWQFVRQFPELTAGVIGLNTPDLPRGPIPPVQALRMIFADNPIYIIQFQDRGVAEWVLSWGRGHDDFIEMVYLNDALRNADAFPPEVLDRIKDAFRPAGALTPPIEYYRNLDRNWELSAAWADRHIDVPCLMISAADDPVLPPALTAGMEDRITDLTKVVIADCGHWTQQERPAETTAAMADFLVDLVGRSRW